MARIKVLDTVTAGKIAAGEVVERPASVVKELMENSLDAGSKCVSVYLAEGGKRVIRVVDDGCGISHEDAPIVFLRHSTSKISTEEDLLNIRTLGFRGEALASISSVARVTIRTKEKGAITGTLVRAVPATRPEVSPDGCPEGTSIEVGDLFFNTPVRQKFLRSAQSEYGKVLEVFKRTALINPGVRFSLAHGSSRPVEAPAGDLRERVASLFGPEITGKIMEVENTFVKGLIGTHELNYSTAKGLYTYVNGRHVRDRTINRAVLDGYSTLLEGSRYPFAVLDVRVPP